ncbi:splicing factor PWI domain-containing protein isoform X1 [Iris pallida]|uniref:Splicing factor PWI domain-containing protein isoform X1 n=1 Tax=Iris pallida TaxID=29817 RepID=A0AAX6IPH8_IRIPA|nr:splicing factor PWI domain-containing protein isoform X1 [Iris pallida]
MSSSPALAASRAASVFLRHGSWHQGASSLATLSAAAVKGSARSSFLILALPAFVPPHEAPRRLRRLFLMLAMYCSRGGGG